MVRMHRSLRRGGALVAGFALVAGTGSAGQPGAPVVAGDAGGLQGACNAATMQAVADGLAVKVTVGRISNAAGPGFADGTRYYAATAKVPAFCQVTGSFVTNPASGKTANFLATLPAAWNGKYLQLGCGGHCGMFAVSNPAMPTITITNQGLPGDVIRKGYAAFATDEGHLQMTAGTWAVRASGEVDDDAITDFLCRGGQRVCAGVLCAAEWQSGDDCACVLLGLFGRGARCAGGGIVFPRGVRRVHRRFAL